MAKRRDVDCATRVGPSPADRHVHALLTALIAVRITALLTGSRLTIPALPAAPCAPCDGRMTPMRGTMSP